MIKSAKPLVQAIEAYHKTNGKYPAELKDLSPNFLEVKGLNYKGWYLYSVESGTHPTSYSISRKIGRDSSLTYDKETNQWTHNSAKGTITISNRKP